jgi:hypothetical protein
MYNTAVKENYAQLNCEKANGRVSFFASLVLPFQGVEG